MILLIISLLIIIKIIIKKRQDSCTTSAALVVKSFYTNGQTLTSFHEKIIPCWKSAYEYLFRVRVMNFILTILCDIDYLDYEYDVERTTKKNKK